MRFCAAASVESVFVWLRAIGERETCVCVYKHGMSLVSGVSGGFPEECPTRVPHKNALQECPTRTLQCPTARRVSSQLSHKCHARGPYKECQEECPTRVKYHIRMSHNTVLHTCPCKSVVHEPTTGPTGIS